MPPHRQSDDGPILSDDARAIAGSQFGGGSDLELVIVPESRTTSRARAAFRELVAAGILVSEPSDGGGVSYRAVADCDEYLKWFARRRTKGRFRLALSSENVIRRRRSAKAA